MKEMWFETPSFHLGANSTIRLGKKWNGYRGDVTLRRVKDKSIIGTAIIVNTEVKRFKDLLREDIRLNQDPMCTEKDFLEDKMHQLYEDFNENSIVTIVTFIMGDGFLGSTSTF